MKATGQLHKGFSGAFGDLIFRQYNGKTVVSRRPVYKNETNTEARRKARGRFREATEFAGNAMADLQVDFVNKQEDCAFYHSGHRVSNGVPKRIRALPDKGFDNRRI